MNKCKLYASRINKRAITILDVPEDLRDCVMELLNDSDKKRMNALLDN